MPKSQNSNGAVRARRKRLCVTSIGSILRSSGIDGLPQLINVRRGDMSIVGPRAFTSFPGAIFEEEILRTSRRRNFKPGLTGLAQVYGYWDDSQSFGVMLRRVLISVSVLLVGLEGQTAVGPASNPPGSSARLKEAVAAFRVTLEQKSRVLAPREWVRADRGNALFALGAREADTARLEKAVVAHRAALEEHGREHTPLEWANTQCISATHSLRSTATF
jgi:hypothetical protein